MRFDSSKGDQNLKRDNCVYCNRSFETMTASQRANHTRWCNDNPKRLEYVAALHRKRTPDQIERMKNVVSNAHKLGKYKDAPQKGIETKIERNNLKHTESAKEKIQKKALESGHRRLKRCRILYNDIWLDSTWELALAQRLDELGIAWIRPEPLRWVDSDGKNHNYFPDLYLPQFDLYLDPKNPMAVKTQKEKLKILMNQYPNIVVLYSLEECQQYIPVTQRSEYATPKGAVAGSNPVRGTTLSLDKLEV